MNQLEFQRKVIHEEYMQIEFLNKKGNPDKVAKLLPRNSAFKKNRFRESVK